MSEHTKEIEELFLDLTAPISEGMDEQKVRLISLENFTKAITQMMDQAYYYGVRSGLDRANSIVSEIFIK